MKYIITERQYDNIHVKRRLVVIDELINNRMREIYKIRGFYSDYCEYGSDTFIDVVAAWVGEKMYNEYFIDINVFSPEWGEIYLMINDYIDKFHSEKIREFYNEMCNDN